MADPPVQPDATECDQVRDSETGLIGKQEQAAFLLMSGLSVQAIADQLGIHRSTLWHWRELETFQAYVNALKKSHRLSAEEGILSMQEEALATVRRIMFDGNDGASLRAATFVLSAVKETKVGDTDARELIRRKQSQSATDLLLDAIGGVSPATFEQRCRELGIEP